VHIASASLTSLKREVGPFIELEATSHTVHSCGGGLQVGFWACSQVSASVRVLALVLVETRLCHG
jgi:hypothetical protein